MVDGRMSLYSSIPLVLQALFGYFAGCGSRCEFECCAGIQRQTGQRDELCFDLTCMFWGSHFLPPPCQKRLVQAGYGSPVARHFRWRSESGVGKSDRCIFEHEVLSRFLEMAALKDGLNLRNLSSVQHCLRRMQLTQEAVSEDPLNPSYEGARHFMGGDERRRGP